MNFQMLRTSPVDLSRYLPDFLFKDKAFTDILVSCSTEHERQRLFLQELAKQFFVETATWGLADWERILGLTPRPEYDYGERRRRILLRLQSRQTSTLDFMARLISRYLDGDRGYVEEHNEEYFFRVMMEGSLIDKAGLIEALETYKPAHLAYDFRFLLVGDTLREDFGASGYGKDDAAGNFVIQLRERLGEAYPYESFDYLPRHGDTDLLHNGLHVRGGADGPTIDLIGITLRTSFEENMQSILWTHDEGIPRGSGIRHGPGVYPLCETLHLHLQTYMEDKAEAQESADVSVRYTMEDWYPFGEESGLLPIHGRGYHCGPPVRNDLHTRDGYPLRSHIRADALRHGKAQDLFEVEKTAFSVSLSLGDTVDASDDTAISAVHYTPARGYMSHDGTRYRGATTYYGQDAEVLLASRGHRNGVFSRADGAIRGRA